MEIPEGARTPTDRQPKQSDLVRPQTHPDGWELLRPTIDLEFWERSELIAAVTQLKQRGDSITMTAANIRVVGQLGKLLQEVVATESNAFKSWSNQGEYGAQVKRIVELAHSYVAELGEASGSEN